MQLITNDSPVAFAQIWQSAATGEWIIREGKLGRKGRIRETGLPATAVPIEELAAPFLERGYVEFDDADSAWIVAQFPSRSAAADLRLIEHAGEWISATLDERGLGYLDGHDRGKRGSDGKLVVNLYARSKDAELGAEAVMAALRAGRADATRATVAYRGAVDEDWVIRFERTSAKLPGPFSI